MNSNGLTQLLAMMNENREHAENEQKLFSQREHKLNALPFWKIALQIQKQYLMYLIATQTGDEQVVH